jgi:prolyl-tRNA editing enzyme YbaK/EbsC (Cys-tRNA(Pro) deacylase)
MVSDISNVLILVYCFAVLKGVNIYNNIGKESWGKMSLESVKAHFQQWGREKDVMEFEELSATVDQAAETIGVIPARIAKTLSFRGEGDKGILVVAAGDAKIDNKKFRDTFQMKARMLTPEEVLNQTGHVVGGVCPFGLAKELDVYLDISMKRFETVFPACGSKNSAIELTCDELFQYSYAKEWVDVCKDWEETEVREKVFVDCDGV